MSRRNRHESMTITTSGSGRSSTTRESPVKERIKTPPAVSIYHEAKQVLMSSPPRITGKHRKMPNVAALSTNLQSTNIHDSSRVESNERDYPPTKGAVMTGSTLGRSSPSVFSSEGSPRRGRWRRRTPSTGNFASERKSAKCAGQRDDVSRTDGSLSQHRSSDDDRSGANPKVGTDSQQQRKRSFDLHSRTRQGSPMLSHRIISKPTQSKTPVYEFNLWKVDSFDDNCDDNSTHSRSIDGASSSSTAVAAEAATAVVANTASSSSTSDVDRAKAGLNLLRRSVSPKYREEGDSSRTNSSEISELPRPTATPKKPKTYKLGAVLGSGTFGKVFKALNWETGALFAVKKMPLDGAMQIQITALRREVSLLQKLKHENIVRYLGTERHQHMLFIYLEFVPGGSVAAILSEFGPLSESIISRYLRQILHGVEYLHGRSIVHRDIKGANILISDSGCVKLVDFGCSKQLAGLRTNSLDESLRALRGSVPYMAPEVIRQTGHGFEADIWSVGATVLEMTTAKHPWPEFEDNFSALYHIATSNSAPPLPKKISRHLRNFFDCCFKIDPKERSCAKVLLTHPFVREL